MDIQKLIANRLKITLFIWLIFSTIILYFLYSTTPDSIGPEGITVFFVVLYFTMAASIHLLALLAERFIPRRNPRSVWRLSYSLAFGFVPVTVLGLQSLDQLALRDVVIFFGLMTLVVFFLSKR